MTKKVRHITFAISLLVTFLMVESCKNREANPEDLLIREIHIDNLPEESFDTITVAGIDYLILERDRNNPHEGFGFMALRGNRLINKQDSILAYQKVILENQIRIISRLEGLTEDAVRFQINAQIDQELGQ